MEKGTVLLNVSSNNEYAALIAGLEWCVSNEVKMPSGNVYGDSMLIAKQV